MSKKLILILCEPRTGSNLLCEAMQCYYNLQCISEFYLNPFVNLYVREDHIPNDLPHKDLLTSEQQNCLFEFLNIDDNNHYKLLLEIYKKPIESLIQLYNITDKTLVVKVMHKHYDDLNLKYLLKYPFVETILLERSNKLEEFVSHIKAMTHDKWYNEDTSNIKVNVDVDKFIAKRDWSASWYKIMKQILANKNCLEINYERDLENFNQDDFCAMFDRWLVEIGLDTNKTNYKMKYFKKQNTAPIEQSILNYDEIVNKLGS